MTKEELRQQWINENPPRYGDERFTFEYPIYKETKCVGHGDYIKEDIANIEYVYWLEQKIIKYMEKQ